MRESMSPVDAAWYRMDLTDNAADVVALLGFEKLPSMETFRRLVTERFIPYRRFTQRAVPDGVGFAWEDAADFDLDRHLRHERLKSVSQRALEERASRIATEPLDPDHPLWRMHIVEGPKGRGAMILKVAHCCADGFAFIAVLLSCVDDPPPVPEQRHVLPAARRLEPWLEPAETVRGLLRAPGRVFPLSLQGSALSLAVARLAAMRNDPATILSRPLTGNRRTAWSDALPHGELRALARAHGATVNELLFGAVAGGMRSVLADAGESVDDIDLRALVPVNLRPTLPDIRNGPIGNRFGLFFLDLPISVPSPTERLVRVRKHAAIAKGRPDAVATWMLLGAVGAIPGIEMPALRFFARKASVVVTSVPGPKAKLAMGGERLQDLLFWVPHPATLGLGVSILTYGGEIRIGVRADEGVLDRPSDLARAIEAEIDELRSARR